MPICKNGKIKPFWLDLAVFFWTVGDAYPNKLNVASVGEGLAPPAFYDAGSPISASIFSINMPYPVVGSLMRI